MEKNTSTKKKKARRKVPQGCVYIQSSYNNTIISITDLNGNVLAWSSSGRAGFAGARKATPFAAQKVVADALERLKPYDMEEAAAALLEPDRPPRKLLA